MKRARHDCGDAECPEFGHLTCARCDDMGPPKESRRKTCPECGRLRSRMLTTAEVATEFGPPITCSCGGQYFVAGKNGVVGHSSPACEAFATMSGGEFVEAQRAN